MLKINGQEVISNGRFAYDGCHKIYILEDLEDEKQAWQQGSYKIYLIGDLIECYKNSCDLRFISNWKLTKKYVQQFEENVEFTTVEVI